MKKMNMVEANNLCLHQEMERNKDIIVLGEDVGVDGGVFRATQGLYMTFGDERVVDTPLSEAGIVGAAIGMALYGLKPVAEIQFEGFTFPAFDQILSHAARIRNRSRGRFTCPIVVRSPYGGGVRALEHHSDAPETFYAHIPGLKVVIPSCPSDAKGLLAAAITDPDPVIFFEPKKIYRSFKEDVDENRYTIPLGSAKVIQKGDDLTLISYGSMVKTCKEALELLEGNSIEFIDLRTIMPFDEKTILESVQKTGRCVIVHEAPRTLGVGAEIIARINEKALMDLKAPVKRVTGYDVTTPLPKLEEYFFPTPERIITAIKETMNF